jgi:hypothetical protein
VRIVILGDFHLNSSSSELTESAMDDIQQVKPDLVIPLGDFGSREKIGSPEGLDESIHLLNRITSPMRPIMGNHDLERESGGGPQEQGTMLNYFIRKFDLQQPYGVLEYDFVRLFFASTDVQPEDSCFSVQECYVSDEQFQWIVAKVKERPGVPIIFFTHAPPIGSGLRTVPRIHVKSTNAYLDQNHDPYRWLYLFRDTPEIIMWYCAHYHLSHIHHDSQTYRYGTRFFTTGVHGDRTRDTQRQSRLLEVNASGISVHTIDHIKRKTTFVGGWNYQGDLGQLTKPAEVSLSRELVCPVGTTSAVANGIAALGNGRYMVATENGYSWETEAANEAVMGTCHIGPALTGIVLSQKPQKRLWIAWENWVGWIDQESPWRFVRDAKGEWPAHKTEFLHPVKYIASREAGGVWVFTGDGIWTLDWDAESGKLVSSHAAALNEDKAHLSGQDGGALILTSSNDLLRYDEAARSMEHLRSDVLAWDSWKDQEALIAAGEDGIPLIESRDGQSSCSLPLPGYLVPVGQAPLPFLCLGGHRVVFIAGKTAYYASLRENEIRKLDMTEEQAIAIARQQDDGNQELSSIEFAIAIEPRCDLEHPLLQVWRLTVHKEHKEGD